MGFIIVEAFVTSGEFNERAQVLYGREVNEYDRTDKFTHYLYNVIEGRGATATERDARRAATDGANVFGQAAVVTNAKDFARSLFNGAEYAARNRSNSEFVSDLYYAFLRYAPDAGGWNYWTSEVGNQGRTAILEAFLNAGPFDVSAGALYREVLWLVPDHLGTPRMIAERSGQPAGIKHHDYLPFGEELFSGISGRDASHGYGSADSARQQFTAYERDDETGLDYAQARYYSSAMGRFTSVDPLLESAKVGIPQSWNRYAYVLNNPLYFVDPTGMMTDLVDRDSGNITIINDGRDQVIAACSDEINSLVSAAQTAGGNYWRELSSLENSRTNNLHMTHDEFVNIARSLYAESSGGYDETYGIFNVLENRAAADGNSVMDQATVKNGVYGADNTEYDTEKGTAADRKKANVHRAIANARTSDFDSTNGAYYWHGTDFKAPVRGSKAHERFYLTGFRFTSQPHDIWGLGDHKSGNKAYDFKYESTAAYGKTTFMKLTEAWMKATGATRWNGR